MREELITRFAPTLDGVLGRLHRWCTLEEEQQGNKPRVSCIPTGDWVCVKGVWRPGTPKALDTYEVTGVPGRSLVKFHPLGTEEDTEGCIGIGASFQVLYVAAPEEGGAAMHKIGLLDSRKAFAAWMDYMAGVPQFMLHVRDYK